MVHEVLKQMINNLNKNYMINCINAQRLSWYVHVDRMTNDRMIKKNICVYTGIYRIG